MIVYDLTCDASHVFEGWFGSSDDFMAQQARGLVTCPACGSAAVKKAPMAPAVGKKGNQGGPASALTDTEAQLEANVPAAKAASEPSRKSTGPMAKGPMPAEIKQAIAKLAEAQTKALKDSTWVGKSFAEESRKMHYGERETAPIHGQASRKEAAALLEEGIAVAPLPLPVAPPDELN